MSNPYGRDPRYGYGQPPPQPTWQQTAKARAKQMGMGFMMGGIVGSSVVVIHRVIEGASLKGIGKTAGGSGLAFGVIFAVGTLIRPPPPH